MDDGPGRREEADRHVTAQGRRDRREHRDAWLASTGEDLAQMRLAHSAFLGESPQRDGSVASRPIEISKHTR